MGNGKKTWKSGMSQEFVDEDGTLHRQYVVHEQVDGYVDVKLPKKARFNNGDFITVFQKSIYDIVTKANLSKGEMKLLLYLIATTQIDNSVVVDAPILCKELNEKRPNIIKHLKGLTDRKIIIRKDGYRGGNVKYKPMQLSVNYDQLNYDLAYNGRIKDYKNKQGKHPEIDSAPIKEIRERNQPGLFKQIDLEDSIKEIKGNAEKEDIF